MNPRSTPRATHKVARAVAIRLQSKPHVRVRPWGPPRRDDLPPVERQAWFAAANAVEDAISAERVP